MNRLFICSITLRNSFLPSFFPDPIRLGEYPYNTSWYRHISDAYWASSYVDSHYWTMDASKRRFDSGSIGSTPFGFHWYCRWYPWIFWFLQSKRLMFDLILKNFPLFADKAFKTILSEMLTWNCKISLFKVYFHL